MTINVRIDGIQGVWGFGENPGVSGWLRASLSNLPQFSDDAINPETSEFTAARVSITLNASDLIRQRFLFQQVDAATTLSVGVSDVAGTLTLTSALPTGVSTLYIGNEALDVITYFTPTSILVSRGRHGTTAASHGAGSRVYIGPTFWRRRVVRIYDADTQVWVGFLDKAPTTNDSGSQVLLTAAHALSLGDDLIVGEGITAGVRRAGENWTELELRTAFWVQDDPTGSGDSYVSPMRCGDGLIVGVSSVGVRSWQLTDEPILGSPLPDYSVDNIIVPVLALGSRLAQANALVGGLHVLEVAANLLFSDGYQPGVYDDVEFNLFPARWSARLRWATDSAAIAQIRQLMADNPGATVDQLILGWDGQPVAVLPIVRGLLRVYGYVLTVATNGAITITRLTAPNVRTNLTDVQPLRDMVKWSNPAVGANDQVIATYGKTPWDPGAVVSSIVEDFDELRGETLELNLEHLAPTRAPIQGAARLLSLSLMRWRGTPILDVRTTTKLALGEYVRIKTHVGLETALFAKPDGTFTSDIDDEVFRGQVISRRWLVREKAWEVRVHLSSWPMGGLLKLRAPALVVDEVTTPSVIVTVADPGWGTADNPGLDWPGYAMPVEAWTSDGAVRTATCGVGVATGWSSGSLTMTTPFDVDPDPGDVIRIARGAEGTLALNPREYVIIDAGDRYE